MFYLHTSAPLLCFFREPSFSITYKTCNVYAQAEFRLCRAVISGANDRFRFFIVIGGFSRIISMYKVRERASETEDKCIRNACFLIKPQGKDKNIFSPASYNSD